jgi:diacylglycerol kinase family enzyme
MLSRKGVHGRSATVLTDLREFRLVADRPMHLEVDGDYLGESSGGTFRAVPDALRVVA